MPQLIGEPAGRIAPVDELVNTLEFENIARRKLDSLTFSLVAGSDRKPYDKITFRPRMMVNTTGLDLTVEMLGQKLFAPIVVGPVSQQKRFHPEGELATARGASAAKAVMVVSSRSSVPVDQVVAQAKAGAWYQADAEADMVAAGTKAKQAVAAGCKAVVLTLSAAGLDWAAIDTFRAGLGAPLVLKGIMTPEEAQAAAQHGVQGVVVSNWVDGPSNGLAAPLDVLPRIADAAAGKVAILMDGGIRRGSDVLKALALGANAVLIARPAMWGLAGYGDVGVQKVTEILQTDLGRDMAMCGKPNVKSLDRATVKVHRW